jgi:hypothetical protein
LSLIDYCCVAWEACSNEGLSRILKIQKRTARLILDQNPIAPSEPLFKQLEWMTIAQRIKYHKYLLVSKCLKKEAPVYLKNKTQYFSERNPYSLRNVVCEKLQIPTEKVNFLRKLLHTLDQIRVITKLPNSEQSYKGKVKTHNYINRQNQSTTGKL